MTKGSVAFCDFRRYRNRNIYKLDIIDTFTLDNPMVQDKKHIKIMERFSAQVEDLEQTVAELQELQELQDQYFTITKN